MPLSPPKYANKRRNAFAASKPSMVDEKMAVNTEILNSWKEVAVYLGRGVRTVQRWELDLGLPVRRPRGKPRSAVIALKPELDQWLTCTSKETSFRKPLDGFSVEKPVVKPLQLQSLSLQRNFLHSSAELLMSRTKEAMERSIHLCTQSQHLCEQMQRALMTRANVRRKKRYPAWNI